MLSSIILSNKQFIKAFERLFISGPFKLLFFFIRQKIVFGYYNNLKIISFMQIYASKKIFPSSSFVKKSYTFLIKKKKKKNIIQLILLFLEKKE